jgi:EAL domain-containing protein (putative c-di-GMP-specific phosphodiesterase class I)
VTQAAERIQKEFSAPLHCNGHEITTSVSIGIALNLIPYDSPEDLLRSADTAMYRAKDRGRGCYELFDNGMYVPGVALAQLESDLRRALSRQELKVFYQPIISVTSWQITGFEALIRWEHPEKGLVSPLEFIPMAEETDLIIPVGRFVLREACRQLCIWQEQFPTDPPLTMSVNLSGRQFSQPDLIDMISDTLAETGVRSSSLKIEITESAIIESIESATAILHQLKALGIQICLDDFGTGYSSLSYLHRFPIDTLKIDRSFVMRMKIPKNNEIVRTIISLANSIGLDVVAEGVETREQIIMLTELDCEHIQGYLLSKPLDGEAMGRLISETYRRPLPWPAGRPTTELTMPYELTH